MERFGKIKLRETSQKIKQKDKEMAIRREKGNIV